MITSICVILRALNAIYKACKTFDFFSWANFYFSSGNSFDVSAGPNGYASSKKTHGVLGILGWGLFSPFGAIFARYFKNQKLWYYFHVSAQFIGFILGLAGVVLGIQLHNKLQVHIPAHEGIGILVLVLSILQVCAYLIRRIDYSKLFKPYYTGVPNVCFRLETFSIQKV